MKHYRVVTQRKQSKNIVLSLESISMGFVIFFLCPNMCYVYFVQILCLQEVQEEHYWEWFLPKLREAGKFYSVLEMTVIYNGSLLLNRHFFKKA